LSHWHKDASVAERKALGAFRVACIFIATWGRCGHVLSGVHLFETVRRRLKLREMGKSEDLLKSAGDGVDERYVFRFEWHRE
jgi:hypothetical protein